MCNYIYFNKFEEPEMDLFEVVPDSGLFDVLCFDCNLIVENQACLECAEQATLKHIEWHEWFSSRQAISVFEPRCKCYEDFVSKLNKSDLLKEQKRVRNLEKVVHDLWMSEDKEMQERAMDLELDYAQNPLPRSRGKFWL